MAIFLPLELQLVIPYPTLYSIFSILKIDLGHVYTILDKCTYPTTNLSWLSKNAWKPHVPFCNELICVCLPWTVNFLETRAILNTLPNQSQQRVCEWDLPILEESKVKGNSTACEPQVLF